jgi:hypothetical protein
MTKEKNTTKTEVEKSEKAKKDEVKSKYWTAIVYEDSAPEDWRDILKISGLRCAISPYHDKDVNPTGEPKKPHWHVILCWDGPTTYNNARKFVQNELNTPIPKELKSVRGMYNYFSHKDNPEKAQYDEKLIEHINGFCLAEFVELTRGEVNEAIKRAFNIIRAVGITEYSGLLDFLEDNGYGDEWDVVKNNVILFNTYITSRRYAEQRMAENIGRVALAQNREKSRDT